MTPRHLLAVCLSVASLCHARSTILIPRRFEQEQEAPEFWWDQTQNHSAPISSVIKPPAGTSESGAKWQWNLHNWAQGSGNCWMSGGPEVWTAWTWVSNRDPDVTGGGFIRNLTSDSTSLAGVSWLLDGRTGEITWNCFVEGTVAEPLEWSEWNLFSDENSTQTIGFVKDKKRWGFVVAGQKVLSKHCAAGTPSVGKRYRFAHGKEIQASVHDDPFTKISSPRKKRSPDWIEKVKQTFKDIAEKVKKFFRGGDQQEGEGEQGGRKCTTFFDLLGKLLDLIFRRKSGGGNPPPYPPSEGGNSDAPPQEPEGDSGGDPPGGADTPPADAEEIDTSQNDAVRDWE